MSPTATGRPSHGARRWAAAWRSGAIRRAGEIFFGVLFILAGAANLALVSVSSLSYSSFADSALFGFVRDDWRSVVVPHLTALIPLLAVFEFCTGVLILAGGALALSGITAAIGFHVALLLFGWAFWFYCVPMLVLLCLQLRGELRSLAESDSSVGPWEG